MLESADDPAATTVWKEHVTDAEYEGAPTVEEQER
jgi:hypothetical protein